MSRLFDPVDLMSQNVAANETKRQPLPVGETTAQVTEMKFTDGSYKDKNSGEQKTWNRLDVTLEITDEDYLKEVGDGSQKKAICFHGIMLDMNGGQIAVGPNKNIKLGQFREACKANGQPLNACIGAYVRVSIVHKVNPKDPDGGVIHEVMGLTQV